jgi:hypothetical protein
LSLIDNNLKDAQKELDYFKEIIKSDKVAEANKYDIAKIYNDTLKVPKQARTEQQNQLIESVNEALGIKGEQLFSREEEGKSELQKFVEEERAAGTSDADIRATLEEFAKDPQANLDAAKIDELMAAPKVEEAEVTPEPTPKPKPGKKTAVIETEHPYLYEGSNKTRVRGIMDHIADAKNISQKTKKGFSDQGARYAVANNAEARVVAKDIIKAFGKEDALTIARSFDLHPSVRSAIFAESIDNAYRAGKKARGKEDKLIEKRIKKLQLEKMRELTNKIRQLEEKR